MNSENSGHLWHKMSQIYFKKLRAHLQISSYFWVFWGKIQLSSAQHVSWFGFGGKIFQGNSLPHMGLSSMPFWSKYTDPPTFMICGINFFKLLNKAFKMPAIKAKSYLFFGLFFPTVYEEEALAEQILSLHFCHDKELSVLSNELSKILKLTAATAKERYVLCRLSSHVPKSH